ncbi:glutamyl-tRNA amidotransferase [Oculatella sp. LEGE 06141]|uniref:allophanate hydrolase-related protein n=1 Tax=Oculatella sp. LEGE 06141 TaxID=1828648 RepID=UPI00351C5770
MQTVNAQFVREAWTLPIYRLWSINDRHPAMLQVKAGGGAIAVEIWTISAEGISSILLQEPPGLCIGKVYLADGEVVLGVLGEPFLCENQREITQWGGWRAYITAVEKRYSSSTSTCKTKKN